MTVVATRNTPFTGSPRAKTAMRSSTSSGKSAGLLVLVLAIVDWLDAWWSSLILCRGAAAERRRKRREGVGRQAQATAAVAAAAARGEYCNTAQAATQGANYRNTIRFTEDNTQPRCQDL